MTDFYIRPPNNLADDYECEQTTIIKKKFLKYISRIPYKEEDELPLSQILEWYPFANTYYSHTEDVDAFARVNHLLGSKPNLDSITSLAHCENIYKGNLYSEKDTQLQYLYQPPVSFLIIGKPGIGEEELGKLLADYWNCVYIEPETLIIEEIDAKTRAGRCIEFNLRCGRAIGVDVIIRLVEKRVRSRTAQHRGFVICGFPLIPNDLYVEDPVSAEVTVFTVQEIFEEIVETAVEIGVPPESPVPSAVSVHGEGEEGEEPGEDEVGEESFVPPPPPPEDEIPLDVGSAIMSNICITGNLDKDFEEQIDFLFSLFHNPFLLIYTMCGNNDVVYKRKDYLFDLFSHQIVDLQREHSDKMVYTHFSTVAGSSYDEIPEDVIDVIKSNSLALDTSQARLLVKLPKDFPANVSTSLDRYRYCALPTIEKHFLVHPYEFLIKVDGRISPVRMFNAVKTKLRTLPLQRVIIPRKLLVPGESDGEGPADNLDVEGLPLEECFEVLKKKQIASSMFKWCLSDWGFKCPVSMSEGDFKDGIPEFAVQFMNRVFFLCDEDAYLKFYRNPRPYLLPPYPKPSCKIFVIGPRCSGKTVVSTWLGYLLKGEVVDYSGLEAKFVGLRRQEYLDNVRADALIEGMDVLNRMREEEADAEREAQVKLWVANQKELLQYTIDLRNEFQLGVTNKSVLVLEMASTVIQVVYDQEEREVTLKASDIELIPDEAEKIKTTIQELQELIKIERLPGPDDIALCEELLSDDEKLMDYLPPSLLKRRTLELATEEDDFVKEFAEKAVENAPEIQIDVTPEETCDLITEVINEVEAKNVVFGNTKGGWIVDGIPVNNDVFELMFSYYLPMDVFILNDEDGYEFLLKRFETRGLNQFRDYRNLFMSIGKPDAAWRSPYLKSTVSYISRLVTDAIGDILDDVVVTSEQHERELEGGAEKEPYFKKHPRAADVQKYREELNKFDEDLKNLEIFLDESAVIVTEFNVANKGFEVLLPEVVKTIDDRYRKLPSTFTTEDRLQELQDFGEPELQDEELGEGEEKDSGEDTFFQNRRFGDTFNYCPVSFSEKWVLWKGKEEFTVKFEDKLYLLSSEIAMEKFLYDPRRYLLTNSPPQIFPPPRICIVGVIGSGKTTVSNDLCRNLGLYFRNYDDKLRNFILPNTRLTLQEIIRMGCGGLKRDIINNYLGSGEALEEQYWEPMVAPLWFEDPVKTFGFVFDGFPRRLSDVEIMVKKAIIPDIVIEMTISEGEVHKRLVDNFMDEWEHGMKEKKERIEKERLAIFNTWAKQRSARFTELLEQKKEERYALKLAGLYNIEEAEEEGDETNNSLISFNSVEDQEDIDFVNSILADELPEPIFIEDPEETLEEAVARFASNVVDTYAIDSECLAALRESCENDLIPWVTVDAGMSEDKVLAQTMFVVDKFKFRNESAFERVYDISVDLADRLLEKGYYFLSLFGKSCPVQINEKHNPIQMFLPMEEKYQLFPVIHRQYIYFLAGQENHDKFKENPLKYTRQNSCGFPLIPMRLGIIGPPKSGKTTLAERFKRDLGMKVISRGQAARYVLRYLEFSELARSMESVLRCGWELTYEMIAKSTEAASFDGRSITQGFVMDGFPCTIEEVRHLAELGLVPRLVIDLQAEHADVFEFLGTSKPKHGLPLYPKHFIQHRYEEWQKIDPPFKDWLDKQYQIVAPVPVKPSLWGVWTAGFELVAATFSEVKHYFKLSPCDVVLRLANMQVSPIEFIERQSTYKHYCPCCLYYDDCLKSGGEPPDRTGVVQFRKHFYYICSKHIERFVKDPEEHLPPYSRHTLPYDLPLRVKLSEFPTEVFEDGVCVICYCESKPYLVLNEGSLEHAVSYRDKIYLFDTEYCVLKFMKRPHLYYATLIHFKGHPFSPLTYRELPVLGMLQQYDVKQLIKALVNTGILRPVIPGLSIAKSAAINVGLYLKTNNPRTPENFLELFKEAEQKYHERRIGLIDYLANMKRTLNPYLYYDEPIPAFVDPLFPYPRKYPSTESVTAPSSFKPSIYTSTVGVTGDIGFGDRQSIETIPSEIMDFVMDEMGEEYER